MYGKPKIYNTLNTQLSTSAYGVNDLFTGQRWVNEIGLYDDRNRFMSPDLGRFLQPDPIGFKGDSSNLYRYVGNDWANKTDPLGLDAVPDGDGLYHFIQSPHLQLGLLTGSIVNKWPNTGGQCVAGARFIAGTFVNGQLHSAPDSSTWIRGPKVTQNTPNNVLIARGWQWNSSTRQWYYPNVRDQRKLNEGIAKGKYNNPVLNHGAMKSGWDKTNNTPTVFDQWHGKPLGTSGTKKGDDWYVVQARTPYNAKAWEHAPTPSTPQSSQGQSTSQSAPQASDTDVSIVSDSGIIIGGAVSTHPASSPP
jgi:RHS repeat-associated protein